MNNIVELLLLNCIILMYGYKELRITANRLRGDKSNDILLINKNYCKFFL